MNSVQKEFRVAVSVVTLFEAPTVAAMAEHLRQEEKVPTLEGTSA
jgi:hypothetical protein